MVFFSSSSTGRSWGSQSGLGVALSVMDHLLGTLFHDRRHHPTRREVVARLILSGLALAVAILANTAPGTFTYLMVELGGYGARAGVAALGFMGARLLIHTVANEIWPRRRHLPWLLSMRQWMWLACGLMENLFAYLTLATDLSLSLGVFLAIWGWGCFLLAFVDAAQEKTDRRCTPQ